MNHLFPGLTFHQNLFFFFFSSSENLTNRAENMIRLAEITSSADNNTPSFANRFQSWRPPGDMEAHMEMPVTVDQLNKTGENNRRLPTSSPGFHTNWLSNQ